MVLYFHATSLTDEMSPCVRSFTGYTKHMNKTMMIK